MKKALIVRLHRSFEDHAHHENDVEFWLARELQLLLGYAQWRNFERVIDDAKTACERAGSTVADHFADVSKMVGNRRKRATTDHFVDVDKMIVDASSTSRQTQVADARKRPKAKT
jgi:DNA-damage-inducible protein D